MSLKLAKKLQEFSCKEAKAEHCSALRNMVTEKTIKDIKDYLHAISPAIELFQYTIANGRIHDLVIRFPLLGNLSLLSILQEYGWEDAGNKAIRVNTEKPNEIQGWNAPKNNIIMKCMRMTLT